MPIDAALIYQDSRCSKYERSGAACHMIGDSKTLLVNIIGPFVAVTAIRMRVGFQAFGDSLLNLIPMFCGSIDIDCSHNLLNNDT